MFPLSFWVIEGTLLFLIVLTIIWGMFSRDPSDYDDPEENIYHY